MCAYTAATWSRVRSFMPQKAARSSPTQPWTTAASAAGSRGRTRTVPKPSRCCSWTGVRAAYGVAGASVIGFLREPVEVGDHRGEFAAEPQGLLVVVVG